MFEVGLREKISNYFLSKKFKPRLYKSFVLKFQNIKNVAIVFSGDLKEETQAAENLKKTLESEGKKVVLVSYLPFSKKEKIPASLLGINYVSKRDFNFWSIPSSTSLINIIKTEFDLVVFYNSQNRLEIQNIVFAMRAPLKSNYGNNFDLCNLNIVNNDKQTDFLKYNQSLINYLKTI